ncbi:unnamed protein product, partial [Ranitomeya imitator]
SIVSIMDAISKAVNNFSCDLLKEIAKSEPNKNIFYSPLSIATVLKMVMSGAGGNTKSQMEKVLHVSPECSSLKECEEELKSEIKELLADQKCKKYQLKIVNRLFGDKAFTFIDDGIQGKHRVTKRGPALSNPMFTLVTGIVGRWRAVCVTALQRPNNDAAAIRIVVWIAAASFSVKQYVQLLKNEYNAEVQTVDFKHNAEAERQKINEWVKCLTNGKITELYEKGSLDESSVAALVNAIYFKGKWANKFSPANTKEGTFHVNKNLDMFGVYELPMTWRITVAVSGIGRYLRYRNSDTEIRYFCGIGYRYRIHSEV